MQPFKLKLANGATVAGIQNTPVASESQPAQRHLPLVVALHGGTYDCNYFDGSPQYTAAIPSKALGVPFVAIDRPCYGGTSSFLPIPNGSSFNQETGSWLHHHILPALWTKFGVPNNCNCIVLLCHSFGSMGGIVAAAMHGKDQNQLYPLGGLIVSGMGNEQSSSMKHNPLPEPNSGPEHTLFPLDIKDHIMFRPGTVDEEVLDQSERLNAISPYSELREFPTVWLSTWQEDWATHVRAPVMLALVEDDVFFKATEGEVETCTKAFKNSVRADGSLIKGAPHCMELSYWSRGWYARCFGFALECSVSLAIDI